mmetsp:Transcript_1712/g.1819  ORF Transcript_1712/g.1819 Transcript_1712/m.1819 type:complete len:399 (+) Transcript_1712:90-1286(+)
MSLEPVTRTMHSDLELSLERCTASSPARDKISEDNNLRNNNDTSLSDEHLLGNDIPVYRPTKRLCHTTATILAWFAISNLIILSTKWLFNNYFPYPLIVTTYYNIVAFLWAAIFSCHPKLKAPRPSKQQFWSYVFPIGFTQALEIGCSNLALKLLTVGFGTILKGGAPVFTFMWGMFFGLERFSLPTVGCLFTISLGIALASIGEGQEFQLIGFCLQLFATALGGLRWAMTHKLLQEDTTGDKTTVDRNGCNEQRPIHQPMSPVTASLYTQPVTALCVLPFALGIEFSSAYEDDTSKLEIVQLLAIMTLIASLVFLLLMSEYWLIKMTSSLTLSVAGTLKETITIGGGIFFFAEHIYLLNVIGFVLCQIGIVMYACLRYERSTAKSYDTVSTTDASIS